MLKKYGFPVVMVLVLGGLIVALMNKQKLYDFSSRKMQEQTSPDEEFVAEKYIQEHFVYQKNKGDFDFTLLEFKSGGCTICKQMEPVLDEIRNWKERKVNVRVVQVLNPNSQALMKYFGISAVPTLVLLNSSAVEVARNYGFISADDLKQKIVSLN